MSKLIRASILLTLGLTASCSLGASCGIGADEDPNNPGDTVAQADDNTAGEGEGAT